MANYYTSPYGTRINVTGLSGNALNRVKSLANTAHGMQAQQFAQKQRTMIPRAQPAPAPGQATIQPVGQPTPINFSNTANAAPPTPPPATSTDNTNTLFPTERIFEPKNYQGSPLYQFQVKQGQNQLAKSLAARGLTNSGKAIQDEVNIPLQAAAQDTERMTQLANQNADRLANIQQSEAGRLERQGNEQWNRAFNIAQLMAQQSPWATAVSGLNNTADILKRAGDAQANYLRDAYQRAAGGGGGGRGFVPMALPTGPNYLNIIPAQNNASFSSNNGWLNLLTQGLSSLI